MNGKTPKAATVKAVVRYAEQLRAEGEQRRRTDVWAKPYMPTDAAARKLCHRLSPDAAITNMRASAAQRIREEREEREAHEQRAARHARRQAQNRRDLAARRDDMTVGQRIDHALAQLTVVSNLPAARIDGDRVQGGEHSHVPTFAGDIHSAARQRALQAADYIESLLDNARVKDARAA